jgi:rod shape-determining protein MreB
VAGDKIDETISDYIKRKHNLAIGEQTAEEIKIRIGTALPLDKDEAIEIQGRDLILGLPKNIKVSSNELCSAISDVLSDIIQVIKQVLRDTPPELSADIMSKGMVLSGGVALLRNLDKLFTQTIGVPASLAEEPLFCVAKGAGVVIENLDIYKKSIMSKK